MVLVTVGVNTRECPSVTMPVGVYLDKTRTKSRDLSHTCFKHKMNNVILRMRGFSQEHIGSVRTPQADGNCLAKGIVTIFILKSC